MKHSKALRQRYRWFKAAVAGIAVSILAQGCALQDEELEGTWVVTEAIQPGVSATPGTIADGYLGLSLTYLDDQAQLGQRHCSSPHYDTHFLAPHEISQRYQVSAESLFANLETVKSVRVTCEDAGTPFGETMLLQPGGTAYTISDGVVFKLEKAAVNAG